MHFKFFKANVRVFTGKIFIFRVIRHRTQRAKPKAGDNAKGIENMKNERNFSENFPFLTPEHDRRELKIQNLFALLLVALRSPERRENLKHKFQVFKHE